MRVKIRSFAAVADTLGIERELEMESGSNVKALLEELATEVPGFEKHKGQLRFAIEEEFVSENTTLYDNAILYLIPPSSGG